MHRCLQVADIVYTVARHIEGDAFGYRNKGCMPDLLRMALACRSFCEPALARLWRHLDDLAVLARTLPAEMLKERKGRLALVRSPSKAQWVAFERFARYIRTVHQELDSVDWNSIAARYPGDQLLPSLRCFHSLSDTLSQYLPIFVRPPLVQLYVEVKSIRTVDIVIECVSSCAKDLEMFVLQVQEVDVMTRYIPESQELAEVMLSMESLFLCAAGAIPPRTLEYLGSLSTLTRFEIEVPRDIPLAPLPFLALEVLTIQYGEWLPATIATLLERISAPNLIELHIYEDGISELEGPNDMHITSSEICDILTPVEKFAQLRQFHFFTHMIVWELPEGGLQTLKPLIALRELEHIWIKDMDFMLRKSDFEALADAWPEMRYLRLGDGVPEKLEMPEPMTPLADLAVFADHFPRLEMLGLRVFIPREGWCKKIGPPYGQSTSRVRELSLSGLVGHRRDWRISAAFLSNVFPHAALCNPESEGTDEDRAEGDTPRRARDMMNKTMKLLGQLMNQAGVRPPAASA